MKNSFMKKLLSSFLALTMVVTFAPANMSYAVNESKQTELKAWQEEVKKATEAEEKANAKLEIARIKADVTKFITACLASVGGVIAAIAGYAYHEKLQLPFYQEKQKLENEKKAKDQEHEREQLKIKQDDDYAKLKQKIMVAAADAGLTSVGFVFGPIGKVIWTLGVQTQFALQGLFGEKVENLTKSQMEKLFNEEYLGKAWNGTKYYWNEFYNSGAMNATGAFLRHPIKTIKGISNGQPDIYVPTPTPLPTPTVGINDDDLTEADVIDINRISVKNFFVKEIGKSERKSCEQDKAANLSNSTHVSENCKNYYAILDLFAELKKKYPNETNPFWEGLLNEKNSQRLVTPTPTPTPTPEWTPTPEITSELTPEVVKVAQIEGEL